MLSVYCRDCDQHVGVWLPADVLRERCDSLRHSHEVMWLDLDNPTEEEEDFVFRAFLPVHPLTLEDIRKMRREPGGPPHFPKAEEFNDYLFVVVNPLRPGLLKNLEAPGAAGEVADTRERATTQLSAVMTGRLLITHHYEPVPAVDELRRLLTKHEARADRGPDYLFHIILDTTVDDYAPLLDHFDDGLDEIEARVMEKPDRELLLRLLGLKRHIIRLRKTLVYEREVLSRLIRGEFALIEEREMAYYRNVYDHLVRFTELIESSREMVSDLMQTHLSAASNRLNEVMKGLTTISTIVLPMTLVAGVYGMNFEVMPETKQAWGYPFALGLMALTGVGSFVWFRRKKWI